MFQWVRMCLQVVSSQVKRAYGFAKRLNLFNKLVQATEHLVQTIGLSVLAIEKYCNIVNVS